MGGDACEGLRLCIPSPCFIATRLSRQVRSVLMPCILVVLTLSSGVLQRITACIFNAHTVRSYGLALD